MHRTFLSHLQSFLDLLAGQQPFQPLPESYFQQPDWQQVTRKLEMPAAWRRPARVR